MSERADTLKLDARQRAMLKEMRIPLWWPEPGEARTATPAAVAPAVRAVAGTPTDRGAPGVSAAPRGERPGGIEMMDWGGLQQAVAGCQACRLCGTRKNTVFGVGPQVPADAAPPRADWLIVGEAPGENEDIQGEPFVGQAGRLLDNMLRAIGVDRQGGSGEPAHSAFITNVLKCRPPSNRNPEPDEVARCQPYLRRQIDLLRPKIIVAMGRFAVQSLLDGSVPDVQATPLGKLRGRVYRYHGVPVVVSYHPAYLLRSLPDKAKAWADLCLAVSVWRGTEAGPADRAGSSGPDAGPPEGGPGRVV